jgi:hypothetical protein
MVRYCSDGDNRHSSITISPRFRTKRLQRGYKEATKGLECSPQLLMDLLDSLDSPFCSLVSVPNCSTPSMASLSCSSTPLILKMIVRGSRNDLFQK